MYEKMKSLVGNYKDIVYICKMAAFYANVERGAVSYVVH